MQLLVLIISLASAIHPSKNMLKTALGLVNLEVFLLPYLLEYKSHFFVPENQSKNGGATYTRG